VTLYIAKERRPQDTFWRSRFGGKEVDGSGSELCPMVGFGISGVEPFGSATRELVN
jgi:hypothetical protein